MQNQLDIVTMRVEEAEEKVCETKNHENNEAEKREREKSDHERRIRELSESMK